MQTVNSAKYASVDGLRKKLQLGKRRIPSSSLHVTLYRLVESNAVFDAGRGWYSTIATPFTPQCESIKEIVLPECQDALNKEQRADEVFLSITLENFDEKLRSNLNRIYNLWLEPFYQRYLDWSPVEQLL